MKKSSRILSAVLAASMLLSLSNVGIAFAGGESGTETAIPGDIFVDFDTDINLGDRYKSEPWMYYTENTCTYEQSTKPGASNGDRMMKVTNVSGSSSSNYLMFFPSRGGWESVDTGAMTETSFKFAVDFSGSADAIKISLNNYIYDGNPATYSPILVNISNQDKKINVIKANSGTSYSVSKSLVDESGSSVWHELKLVTVFNDPSADGKGTGYSAAYLDDELLGGKITFDYSGTYPGPSGTGWAPEGGWDNSGLWSVKFEIEAKTNPSSLYIDDFRMHRLDYTELKAKISEAENMLADCDDPSKAEALENAIASANAVLEMSAVPTQAMVDTQTAAITAAINIPKAVTPDILVDFNTDFVRNIDWAGRNEAICPWGVWAYDDGFKYGVKETLEDTTDTNLDRALKVKSNLNGATVLYYFPFAGNGTDGKSWGPNVTIKAGEVVETSFDMAVTYPENNTGASGDISIALNPGSSTAVGIKMSQGNASDDAKINSVVTGSLTGTSTFAITKSVDGAALTNDGKRTGRTEWHKITFLTKYDGAGNGKACVYFDGKLLKGSNFDGMIDFICSGTTSPQGNHAPNWGPFDNTKLWGMQITNSTPYASSDVLYMDNLRFHVIDDKKEDFNQKLEYANALIENAVIGTDMGQYSQEAVDALRAEADRAALINNEEAVLYTQSLIDDAYDKLVSAIDTFEKSAVSDGLVVSKNNKTITAVYTKKSDAAQTMNARVIIAVYDKDNRCLGVSVDSGDGSISFEGSETKTLSAEFDITEIPDAIYAVAYAWDSLTNMRPLVSSKPLQLQ